MAKAFSGILAGFAILFALSQPTLPSNQLAATEVGVTGLSGATSNTAPIVVTPSCSVTSLSESQKANGQCPSDTSKYDYNCSYPGKDKEGKQCEKGATCQASASDATIPGTCQCPNVCAATKTTGTQVAKNNTPGVASDAPEPGGSPPPISSQLPGGSSATPVSSQLPGTQTGGVNGNTTNNTGGNTGAITAPSSGNSPVSTSPVSTQLPSSFSGNPNLNTIGVQPSQPVATQNPFAPVSSPSEYTGTGGYTATRPTFGGSSYYTPVVTSASPLTNFVSSIGSIGLSGFFNSVTSFFSAAPASAPTTNAAQVEQIIVQPNPVLANLSSGQPASAQTSPQISTYVLPSWAQLSNSGQTQQEQYQSLVDFLNGTEPEMTPSEIATIVQGDTNPTSEILNVSAENSAFPAQNAIAQQGSELVALNAALDLQAPTTTPLATGIANGIENQAYQNIPEQFYEEEAVLAQAQSNYQWLQAQIAAWQNAESAGVCDTDCQSALATLQNEAPSQFSQVQQLQTLVAQGPSAFENATSTSIATSTSASTSTVMQLPPVTTQVPGAGQESIVESGNSTLQTSVPAEGAPFYVEQNNEWCDQYKQCIPQSSFATSPAQYAYTQSSGELATSSTIVAQHSAPVDPITAIVQTVRGWVNDIISLFTPAATSTTGQAPPCSLFKSLFGGCSGY